MKKKFRSKNFHFLIYYYNLHYNLFKINLSIAAYHRYSFLVPTVFLEHIYSMVYHTLTALFVRLKNGRISFANSDVNVT